MMAASSTSPERLSAMLAVAESEANPFDGERLAALNAVERALKQRGLRLRDLAVPVPVEQHKEPLMGTWRDTCRRCLEQRQALRDWERGFLTDLPKFKRISSKQRYILSDIAVRLGVRA